LIAGGVGKATIGGASPRADAEPSIWITDTVAEVLERLLLVRI